MMNTPSPLTRFQNKEEEELWHELRDLIKKIVQNYSGIIRPARITRNWFNDKENYGGRWAVINLKVFAYLKQRLACFIRSFKEDKRIDLWVIKTK